MPKKIDKKTMDAAVERYKSSGLSIKKVAAEFGMTPCPLQKALKKLGLIRSTGGGLPESQKNKIDLLASKGFSVKEIAEKVGVEEKRISIFLNCHGISIMDAREKVETFIVTESVNGAVVALIKDTTGFYHSPYGTHPTARECLMAMIDAKNKKARSVSSAS